MCDFEFLYMPTNLVLESYKKTMAEYTITKYLRLDKPVKRNGKYPLYLRVRVRDKDTKLPTNIDVRLNEWDSKRKEVKLQALRLASDKIILKLETLINNAMLEGKLLTTALVKELYAGKEEKSPECASFYTYYLEYIERRRKEGLNPETIRVYMTTYNVMKEFREDFRICDIDLSLVEEFDAYMRDVNKNSAGGRQPKHKNFRSVILDIEKHGIPVENPYKWFRMASSGVREVYLSKEELSRLVKEAEKLPLGSTAREALTMYIFSCYCGLRFSDARDLEWSNIDFENGVIRQTMIKTQSEVITPLFPLAEALLKERIEKQGCGNKVFAQYAEPTFNKALRKYAQLAGIDKHLTYHSSRHTFATLLVIDDVDIYKVSKYLGHKSVNMTQRYLKYNLSIAKQLAKDIDTFTNLNPA